MSDEQASGSYLSDLAERLMNVPVMYGIDQSDVDRLRELAEPGSPSEAVIRQAYEEGFEDGVDHENIPWKYPPIAAAWENSDTKRRLVKDAQ